MKKTRSFAALVCAICLSTGRDARCGDLTADAVVADKLMVLEIGPDAASPGTVRMADGMSLSGTFAVGGLASFSNGVPFLLPLGDVPMGAFTNMPGGAAQTNSPVWWGARGVTESGEPCDYAAAVQGQVKWVALQAAAEFQSRLGAVGGMGSAVSNLIASFSLANSSLPVTLGQLKNAAKPFCDRLAQVGIVTNMPWAGTPNDYALANAGQVKFLFSFDLERDCARDSDGDGMPDFWEAANGFDPAEGADAALDADGDGVTNLREFSIGTDPGLFDSDGDGLGDGAETEVPFLTLWDAVDPRGRVLLDCGSAVQVTATDTARAALLRDGRVVVFTGSGPDLRAHTNDCGAAEIDATDAWVAARLAGGGVRVWREAAGGGVAETAFAFTNAVEISGGFQHLLVRHAGGKVTCLIAGSSGAPEADTSSFCETVTTAARVFAGSAADAVLMTNGSFRIGNAMTTTYATKTFAGTPTPVPVDAAAGTNRNYVVLFSNGYATAYDQGAAKQYDTNGVVAIAGGGDSQLLAVLSNGCNAVFAAGGTSWSVTAVTNRLKDSRSLWWRRNSRLAVAADGSLAPLRDAVRSGRSLDFFAAAVTPGGLARGIALACSGTCATNGHSDADGLPDGWEVLVGLDPLDASDGCLDNDGDGLTNPEEFEWGTDPFLSDTDGDGYGDGWEAENGFDPADPADTGADPDSDGLTNAREHILGSDPGLFDSDGDGLGDGAETEVPFLTLWDAVDPRGRVLLDCGSAVQVTATDTARAALLRDGRVVVFTGSGPDLRAHTNDCGAAEIDATDAWVAARLAGGGVRVWRETAGGGVAETAFGFTNAVEVSGGFQHLLVRHADGKVTCLIAGSSGVPEADTSSFCETVTTAARVFAGSVADAVLMTNGSFRIGNAMTTTYSTKTFAGTPTPVPVGAAAGTNRNYVILFSNGYATVYDQGASKQYDTNGVVAIAGGGGSQLLAVLSNGCNAVFTAGGTSWSVTAVTNRLIDSRSLWWRRSSRLAVAADGSLAPLRDAVRSGRSLDFFAAAVTPGGLARGIALACSGTCATNGHSDADGLPDGWEVRYGLNPRDASDLIADSDGDGLTNTVEYAKNTDPLLSDTDGDGYGDGWEAENGFDPADPADTGADSDGDGLPDGRERVLGSDPGLFDSDGDGLGDGAETEVPFLTLWDSAGDVGSVFMNCQVSRVTASDTARAALLSDGRVIVFSGSGSGLQAYTNDCGAVEIDATETWIAARTAGGRVTVWPAATNSVGFADAGLTNVVGISGGGRHLLALHGGGDVTCLTNGPSGFPIVRANTFCTTVGTNAVFLSAGVKADAAVFKNGNVLFGDVFSAAAPVQKTPVFGPAAVAAGSNLNFIVQMTNGQADAYYGSSYTRVAGPTGTLFVAAGGSSNMVAALSNGSNAVFSTGKTAWSYTVVTNRLKGGRDLWWRRDCALAVTNGGCLLPLASASSSGRKLDYYAAAVTPRGLKLGIAAACSGTCPTNAHSDADNMPDGWELRYGYNPRDASDQYLDSDDDGLTNAQEFELRTDPFLKDTDGDGLSDGAETEAPFLTLWDASGSVGAVFTNCRVTRVTASDTARAALLSDGSVVVFTGSGSGLKAYTNTCGAVEIDATESWIAARTAAGRVTVWPAATNSFGFADAGITNIAGLSGGYGHLLARHADGRVTCLKGAPSGAPMVLTNLFCTAAGTNVLKLAAGASGDAAVLKNGTLLFGDVFSSSAPSNIIPASVLFDVVAGADLNFLVQLTNGQAHAYTCFGSSYAIYAGPTGVQFVAAGGSSNMVAVLSNGSNAVFSSGETSWSYAAVTNRLKESVDLWWKRDCGIAVMNGGGLMPLASASSSDRKLDYRAAAVTPRGLKLGIAAACSGTCPTNMFSDEDGMPDGWEVQYGLNAVDGADGDGDLDGDGLLNVYEYGMGTNPALADSDGDGMGDLMEIQNGFNPAVFDTGFPDSDGDGLDDFRELIWGTDPAITDTDHDGLSDYKEIYENLYHGHAHTNVTANGVFVYGTDPTDPDCDDDGLNDGDELKYGTDPWDADTDDDGISDREEVNDFYLFVWGASEIDDRFFTVTNALRLENSALDDSGSVLLENGGVGKLARYYYFDSPCFVTNAIAVDSKNGYRTAMLSDGRALTWMDRSEYYYGINTNYSDVVYRGYGSSVANVACGESHTVVRLDDGSVFTWWDSCVGYSYYNQTNGYSLITDAAAIAAGLNHSLALLSDGRVKAWGQNDYAQTNVPAQITDAIAVAAGYHHSAALLRGGKAVVWGYDNTYQICTNAARVTNAVEIASGAHHCIVRLANNTDVYAWGMWCGDMANSSSPNYCRTNFTFSSAVNTVRAGGYGSTIILDRGLAVMVNVRQPTYLRVKDCLPFGNGNAYAIAALNPLSKDTDEDGLPDGWELRFGFDPLSKRENITNIIWSIGETNSRIDPDNDGLTNFQEFEMGTNPTSADGDGDGLNDSEEHAAGSDAFKPDTDGDGLLDGDEVKVFGSSPLLRDTDNDGLPDYDEARRYGTSPSRADTDGDGLTDAQEILTYGTDPNAADTDDDLLPDKWEIERGYDPFTATGADTIDSDGDGLPDYWELRFFGSLLYVGDDHGDGDGISNLNEFLAATDPTNSLSFVSGLPLGWQTCDLGAPDRIGGASFSNGVFKLVGGDSPDSSSDRYRICYQPVWGNFTLTARIVSVGDGCVGGVFVRKSKDPGAVKLEMSAEAGGRQGFLTRLAPAASCTAQSWPCATSIWLRIERKYQSPLDSDVNAGGTITLSYSNGIPASGWTVLREMTNYCDMGTETIVGLYARSGEGGGLLSSRFADVTLTTPSSWSGYCPFGLSSDAGVLFGGRDVVTVQPLVTGVTYQCSTTTNGYSYSSLNIPLTNLVPARITNTLPAFVRIKASRSGFTDAYKSLFVSNRHLHGWNAQYYPLTENAWPSFSGTNLAWVSHLPSEDFEPDGNVAGGFWRDRVAVRLETALAVPCTVNKGGSSAPAPYVFKIERKGAVRIYLSGDFLSPLLDKPDSDTWQTSVVTNSVGIGLTRVTIDLKSWDGPAGVRLWWRAKSEPDFRRVFPTDCFVNDYNTNGYSDAAESWLGANWGLWGNSDTDGDGTLDLDEALRFHSSPFDSASRPLAAIGGVTYSNTAAGLVVSGFRDAGGAFARVYDQAYPYTVTSHVGTVRFLTDAAFSAFLPSNSPPSGLTFEGYYVAETNGWQDFSVFADDRAVLELDGVPLVQVATPGTRTGGAYLMAGFHAFRLAHENRAGGKLLELSSRGAGGQFGLVPSRFLRRPTGALDEARNRLDTDADGIPDLIDEDDFSADGNADTDHDGVSDEEEREFTLTDPYSADISTNHVWRSVVPGEDGNSVSGEWFAEDGGIYCASRNGTAEFAFTTGLDGFYWIDLYGREFSEYAAKNPFNVELSIDGCTCGRQTFDVPVGSVGCVRFYTPYLTAGSHSVTVRWINALERHSLLVERLVVTLPGGGDADGDGVADWAETRMTNLLAIAAQPLSHTSPVCLEGSAAGCMDATVLGGFPTPDDDPGWAPGKKRLPGNAWYADVPLASNGVTRIIAGFAGAPPASTSSVEWVALNVAACREMTVRQSDTLKFCIAALGTNAVTASLGTNAVRFTVGTNSQDLATNVIAVAGTNTPVYFMFGRSGPHVIRAAWSNGLSGCSLETRVDVVSASFSSDPLLVVGEVSDWSNPSITSNLWIESDPHLLLEWGKGSSLKATLRDDRTAYVSARLGEGGPVLATAKVDAFVYSTHNESGYMKFLYALSDGTGVFEGRITVPDLRPDFTVTLRFLCGLNYFDGGLHEVTFGASDFDENGELVFRMYVTGSSFCHVLTFKQGDTVIKYY